MPIQQDVIKINSTSKIIDVFMVDANGKGKTGLVPANLTIYAWKRGLSGVASSLVPIVGATALDVYESLKWQEVGAGVIPGLYQFSLPNTVLVSSSNLVSLSFVQPGATDHTTIYEIRLSAEDENVGVQIAPLGLRQVVIETGLNCEQAIRGIAAVQGGDTIGADSASITFKGMNDSAVTRAIGDQDEQGNRINTVWTL